MVFHPIVMLSLVVLALGVTAWVMPKVVRAHAYGEPPPTIFRAAAISSCTAAGPGKARSALRYQ